MDRICAKYVNGSNSIDISIRGTDKVIYLCCTCEPESSELTVHCQVCAKCWDASLLRPFDQICIRRDLWTARFAAASAQPWQKVRSSRNLHFQTWALLHFKYLSFVGVMLTRSFALFDALLLFFIPPASRSHARHLKAAGSAITPLKLQSPCLL